MDSEQGQGTMTVFVINVSEPRGSVDVSTLRLVTDEGLARPVVLFVVKLTVPAVEQGMTVETVV